MSEAQGAASLPIGTSIDGCVIERVAEQGRFSISYIATENGRTMVVREFAPQAFSVRDGLALRAIEPEDRNALRWWLRSFIDQSQVLSRLKQRALPNVHRVFEANGTAYSVSDPVAGEALETLLDREGALEEGQLRPILKSLLDGLERAHAAGLLHRDVRPRNVMIGTDGNAVLVDFAVLRAPIRLKSGLLAGAGVAPYSAPEELSSNGNFGPWTDLYAVGALAYRAVSGIDPPSAQERRAGAVMLPAAQASRIRASDALLSSIDWALMLQPETRPQSVVEFRSALSSASVSDMAPALLAAPAARQGGMSKFLVPIIVLALAGVGYWWFAGRPSSPPPIAVQPDAAAGAPLPSPSTSPTPAAIAPAVTSASPSAASSAASAETSSLDRLALDLMSKDRKAQDAARDQQQQKLEELAKRDLLAKAAAAKLAGTTAATGPAASTPAPRQNEDAAAKSSTKTPATGPAVSVPAEQSAADDTQSEALKAEVARLRAELQNRLATPPAGAAGAGAAAKPAGSSMASYRESMNALVTSRLRYPENSRENIEEGNAVVRVRLQRNGALVSATVIQRSGFPLLDAEASNVFSRVGRFAPVPADIFPGASEIDFTLPIRFKLSDK